MNKIEPRAVDELGRFVLPLEIREALKIDYKDLLSISIDGDSIVLKKTGQKKELD